MGHVWWGNTLIFVCLWSILTPPWLELRMPSTKAATLELATIQTNSLTAFCRLCEWLIVLHFYLGQGKHKLQPARAAGGSETGMEDSEDKHIKFCKQKISCASKKKSQTSSLWCFHNIPVEGSLSNYKKMPFHDVVSGAENEVGWSGLFNSWSSVAILWHRPLQFLGVN